MKDTYRAGKWLALCQRCGFKYYSDQLKLEWTDLRVCKDCFETRQPLEFIKAVKEKGGVPWSRHPKEEDVSPDYIN